MAKKPSLTSVSDIFEDSFIKKGSSHISFVESTEEKALKKAEEEADKRPQAVTPLVKSILNVLNGPSDSIERLAFATDPAMINRYQSLYRMKVRLIPDEILKRIAIQDDLVASIVMARENHVSCFGRPRSDRFSTGYIIEPNAGVIDKMNPEAKAELDKRIKAVVRKLATCGEQDGWDNQDRLTFSQWLKMSTRNAIVVGRIACERIWVTDSTTGEDKFHSFRVIDAGTIYRAAPVDAAASTLRQQAKTLLEGLSGKKLIPEGHSRRESKDFAWVQVVNGRPVQAFDNKECVVHNFYPVPDVELDGYPVTPIDTMISAVTTHINIVTHNKIYFQTGRAARGMLVIKSDDADENVMVRVKSQFNASINSVANAHRMPVFAVGTGDDISWVPIDNSGRDMEFQYLTDMNARVILSAFQMSPEELPGWSYLSRGTNSQSLSESNNEYSLIAARDLGIRPLLAQFEDFINVEIFPLFDEALSKLCRIKLVGLDAETAEKESIRTQQDAPLHMTYDQVLGKVEKKVVGKLFGGEFPLNPQFQSVLDKYKTVGEIEEMFFGVEGASKDKNKAYRRDPFWFQFQQMQMQQQQMQQAQQAQAQQAQMQQQQQGGQQSADPNAEQPEASGVQDTAQPGNEQPQEQTEKQKTAQDDSGAGQAAQKAEQDLTVAINQALGALSKGEEQLPHSKRLLLARHRQTMAHFMQGWEQDMVQATKEIMDVADAHIAKGKPKK